MTSRPHWFGMPAFEDAVLDAIIHEQNGTDSGIRTHGLRLKERNFTGAGLYSNFFYEDEGIGSTANMSPGRKQRTLSSNVFAIAPGTDDIGLGLILFLEGDRVRTLEAHTYGPILWWGHVEQFSLYRSMPNASAETRS